METKQEEIRVLAVDDNASALRMLEAELIAAEGISLVGTAANGRIALDMIAKLHPDVVLLDIGMPELDGFGVMESLAEWSEEDIPQVIMLSAMNSDEIIARAMSMGARYYIVKPFDPQVLCRRILDICRRGAGSATLPKALAMTAKSRDEQIAKMFLTIGIPAHIKGYHFMREAVKLVLDDPTMMNRITKELYPTVGKRFNTTASKVERAIRHAIEVAWSRGRTDIINDMFGHCVYTPNDKPSNGEFIALIADKISFENVR